MWINGRKGIFKKISSELKPGEKRIWVHCASLGEFEQGRTLIEILKIRQPEYKIVLTFFSPSGYEVRKKYEFADYIFYLPADTSSNAKKFINLIKPEFAVFIKYEFWFHYFRRLEKEHIPLLVISAVFHSKQVFFRWYGTFFRRMLSSVTHFFVQDEKSDYLLREAGFGNSTVIQDTRIDRVSQISKKAISLPEIEFFLNNHKAVIGGSIYLTESKFLNEAKENGLLPGKLILVPHNVDEENIKNYLELWGKQAILYTDLGADETANYNYDVLIVNTVGLLSSIYKYGSFAVIGGGFGHSIHNILEPAAFSLPVLFGPHYHKFKEAHELLASGGAFTFRNFDELRIIIEKLKNAATLKVAGQTACDYISQRTGSSEVIYSWIIEKKMLK